MRAGVLTTMTSDVPDAGRAARLREHLRRWGLLRTVYQRVMARLGPRLTIAWVFTRPLVDTPEPALPAGYTVCLLDREALLLAARDPALQMTPEFVDAALSRGDFCVGACHEGQLLSFVWRSFSATRHVHDVWLTVQAPHRYAYKALTRPAWRGRHLARALAPLADRLCMERGWVQGISFVETHNFPSLANSAALGNRRIGLIGFLRAGGRVFTFRTAGPRRAGFGFVYRPDGTAPPEPPAGC